MNSWIWMQTYTIIVVNILIPAISTIISFYWCKKSLILFIIYWRWWSLRTPEYFLLLLTRCEFTWYYAYIIASPRQWTTLYRIYLQMCSNSLSFQRWPSSAWTPKHTRAMICISNEHIWTFSFSMLFCSESVLKIFTFFHAWPFF